MSLNDHNNPHRNLTASHLPVLLFFCLSIACPSISSSTYLFVYPSIQPSSHPLWSSIMVDKWLGPRARLPGFKSGSRTDDKILRWQEKFRPLGTERRDMTPNWRLRGGCTFGTIIRHRHHHHHWDSFDQWWGLGHWQSWPVNLGLVPGMPPCPWHPDFPTLTPILCSAAFPDPVLQFPLTPPSLPSTCQTYVPRALLLVRWQLIRLIIQWCKFPNGC